MAAATGRGAAAVADSFQLSKSSHLTKAEEYATFLRPMGFKSGAIFRFDQPDSEANIAFEPDGQLKAGTFAKIVEKMTGKNAEPTLNSELLLTYRSFCTPMELFDALVQRFLAAPAADRDIVRIRVTGVMKIWLDKYWYDFGKEEMLLYSMSEFLLFLSTVPGSERTADTLKKTFDKKKELGDQRIGELVTTQPSPKPFIPQVTGAVVDVLDINSEELARQVCITEFQLFQKLRPWEFIGQAWSKAGKEQKAPNLLKMIDRFNILSSWAISEICRCESLKRRGKVLQKMVELAIYLRQYNNYNSLMAIIAALNNSSVSRLKNTFSQLPQRVASQLADVTDLVSQLGNYAKLRNAIHSCTPPLVPYLGMYLTDLTFIDENRDTTETGLINFSKRRQIANVVQNEIAQYQQEIYNLEPVPTIQQFLSNLQYFDDKTNYKLSTWIEPRQGTIRSTEKPPELMSGEDVKSAGSQQSSAGLNSTAVVNGMSLNDDSEQIDLEFLQGYRFYTPDAPHNIKRSNDPNTGAVIVHAATVDKLVERLSHERLGEDATFLPNFMAAYRYFMTGYDLLDSLIMRWHIPRPRRPELTELWREKKQVPIRKRVLGIIKHWIERYYADFVDDPHLWEKLSSFVEALGTPGAVAYDPAAGALIRETLERAATVSQQNQQNNLPSDPAPPSVVSKPLYEVSIMDLDPADVAKQFTLLCHTAFCQIRPSEAAYGRWRDVEARVEYCPNLTAFFQLLDVVTANIDYELGQCLLNPHDLTAVISRWIDVAQHTAQFNNWAGLRAIVFSLDKVYAQELQAVWASVAAPTRTFFADVRKLAFDASGLKAKISSATPPQVPALDVALSDASLLEAQMPDWVFSPDPLVNFEKFQSLGALIAPVFHLQQHSYYLNRIDVIQSWLTRQPVHMEPLSHRIQNRSPIDEVVMASAGWTAVRAAQPSLRNLGFSPSSAPSAPPPAVPPAESAPSNTSSTPAPISTPPLGARPGVPPPAPPKKMPPLPAMPPAAVLPRIPVAAVAEDPVPVVDEVAVEAANVSLSNPETRNAVLQLLRTSPEIRAELDHLLSEVLEDAIKQAEREIAVEAEAHEINKNNPHAEFYRTIQREFPGCKVTKWSHQDTQGVVYGFADQIECDMIKRGEDTFLCDIRPEVLVENVALLLRIGKLYRTLVPKGSLSCIVVAKSIHPKALAVAQKCKIKVFISQ